MATPQVPPRPIRSKPPGGSGMPDAASAAPKVPPRPAGRLKDRTPSPDRYAPSPLNVLPRKASASALYSNAKSNRSTGSIDAPPRPPSVTLPSLGQEGNEYGDLDMHEQQQNALEKTRSAGSATMSHVASELPLHAPKPGLSKIGAKAQVAAVTRTDSSQAAVALGMSSPTRGVVSPSRDDPDPHGRPLNPKTSSGYIRSGSSLSAERPPSASQLDEHGIPQIGRHVPLLFNAGDVQAPSPAPGSHNNGPTSDSIEDVRQQRHHRRKHSGREVFHGPPGSYGLHGHGSPHNDQFEKSWYAKHPEEQVKEEQGHYGSALSGNRPEFALSSEDLNKIVRASAKGAGFGTVQNIVGLPDEQIGFMASDEYANRLKSPRVQTGAKHRPTNSQTHVESPLRRTSFPQDSLDAKLIPANKQASAQLTKDGSQGVIHIDFPEEHLNRITGEGVDTHEGHGQRRISVDHGYAEEHGYHAPILASDELTPGGEWLQPAMSPVFPSDRRGSAHFNDHGMLHQHLSHLGGSASSSRAGSRPGSIHGVAPMTKIHSHDDHDDRHTPLENVEEYEPLFPDDDGKPKKPATPAERFKQRPELKQRFPSLDIWEDTPDSLRLETEVDSPEPAEQRLHPESAATEAQEHENIKAEAAKLGILPADGNVLTPSEELRAKSAKKLQMPAHAPAVTAQRFPSRDIWEDSPDYAALTTEVTSDLEEELKESSSAEIENDSADAGGKVHPSVPPRPVRATGSGASQEAGTQPDVPPRPLKKLSTESTESMADGKPAGTDARRPPSIPERPKPQIPSRPSKSASRDSTEGAPLDKSISAGSNGSVGEDGVKSQKPPPPAVKAKPNIPMRPTGGKIAALQADFMANLNSRLKTGPPAPPAPKTEEPEEEKLPLQDARKGRARGPARRKPGVHSATQQEETNSSVPKLSFSSVWTVWHSDSDGSIVVPPLAQSSVLKEAVADQEQLSHEEPSYPLARVISAGDENESADLSKGEALHIEPGDSIAQIDVKGETPHNTSEGAAAQPAVTEETEPQVTLQPEEPIASGADDLAAVATSEAPSGTKILPSVQDGLLNKDEPIPAPEKPTAVEDPSQKDVESN